MDFLIMRLDSVHFHVDPARVFVAVILISLHVTEGGVLGSHEQKSYQVCRSPECVDLANDLLSNMNSSVKPCEDFFNYSCGGWIAKNPIPDHELHIYQFDTLRKRKNSRLAEILESYNERTETMSSFRKAHAVYASCINTSAIERHGLAPLVKILKDKGGWPILEPADKWNQQLTWQKVVPRYMINGITTLMNVQLMTDFVERKKLYVTMAPFLTSVFQSRKHFSAYKLMVELVMRKVSPGLKKTQEMDRDVDDLMDFGNRLLNVGRVGSPLDYDRYEIHTIEKFQRIYDANKPKSSAAKVNWLEFYQLNVGRNKNITKDSKIIVAPFNVSQFISVLDQTSPRTIVNYVHWKFLHSMMPYTIESFRNISVILKQQTAMVPPPRRQECVELSQLDHALAFKYVSKYFSPANKSVAMRIIGQVRNEILKRIRNSEKLKGEEKRLVELKLLSMVRHVGYPDWYSADKIDQFYAKLDVGNNLLENQLALLKFEQNHYLEKMDTPYDVNWFTGNPLWTDAGYSTSDNKMLFPAAFFQRPFFESDQVPIPAIYATFGSAVAHEITHAFDSWGSLFDQDGRYRRWWSNETYTEFDSISRCFANQFKNYTAFAPMNMTGFGDLYDYEEIADTAGVHTSFDLYKALTKNEQEVRLPGLEHLTGDQLFFILYARTHCSAEKPEYFTSGAAVSEGHDLPFLRLRGVVSNLQSFSDAFGCKKGSLFNPSHRCSLWK